MCVYRAEQEANMYKKLQKYAPFHPEGLVTCC